MDRREFLKTMAMLTAWGAAGRITGNLFAASPAESAAKQQSKVRSVIELWIWGGPSHLETFDPKPNAGQAYNGGYGDIPTNVPGIRISEFLPKLAQQMDKFSIIRSMCHGTNAHETATYLMQTGRMPGDGITYPAIGAVKGALFPGHVRTTLLGFGRVAQNVLILTLLWLSTPWSRATLMLVVAGIALLAALVAFRITVPQQRGEGEEGNISSVTCD